MKDIQENKLSMYLAVKLVCENFNATWSTLPAFADAFTEFRNKLKDFQKVVKTQSKNITGVAKDKEQEKEEMILKALQVTSAIYAFAKTNGNEELATLAKFSPTRLRFTRDALLLEYCNHILALANENAASLVTYGISTTDISSLQSEIEDFETIVAKPRETLGTRVDATSDLSARMKGLDFILKNRMDPLMLSFKTSSATFYAKYKNARMIINLGIRHEKEAAIDLTPSTDEESVA